MVDSGGVVSGECEDRRFAAGGRFALSKCELWRGKDKRGNDVSVEFLQWALGGN